MVMKTSWQLEDEEKKRDRKSLRFGAGLPELNKFIESTASYVGKGIKENPGALGILDPRVWGAMNRSRKNLKDLKPIKPIPPYDSTQGADLPEELLQGYEQNLSSHNAEQALEKSKKSIAAVNALASNKRLVDKAGKITEEGSNWAKDTSKSPAAQAGFSPTERAALQQQHREWKAARSTQVEQQAVATKGVSQKDYWNNKTGAPSVDFNPKNTLNIVEMPKGTDLGELNIDYNTPPKGWDAGAAFKQDSAAGLSGAGEAAAGAAARAVIDRMIAKITAPKKGEEGANRSGGAISGGGNPWDEMYAPSFYNV